jgi:predicted RNA binding protein YcfA (HicA-like mRNA interferase family)
MKYRDLIKKIEEAGWRHETTRGSHMQFGHPTLLGKVTVPGGGKWREKCREELSIVYLSRQALRKAR